MLASPPSVMEGGEPEED